MNKYTVATAIIIMFGLALPKAIEYDHYVALLIWLFVFLDCIL